MMQLLKDVPYIILLSCYAGFDLPETLVSAIVIAGFVVEWGFLLFGFLFAEEG